MRKPQALHRALLFSYSQNGIFFFSHHPSPPYSYTQVQTYVQVYMKWKKDPYFDSIDSIHKSLELKPIIAVKNFFIVSSSPHDNYSIPISAISKKGLDFGVSIKVARFLRNYPSVFEEFKGPLHNLPWFRLTSKAIELHKEEMMVYKEFKDDIAGRLKKLILMTGSRKMLPLKVIKGLRWYLGLPDEFFKDPLDYIGGYGCFQIADIEGGLKALAVLDESSNGNGGKILSTIQKNAMKRGVYSGGADEPITFPLFPSKGLRLKQKIKDWLEEFQKLPYVSPYDDSSDLNPDSDVSEKRVMGLLHELLCLFVEHAAERKTLFCLKKPLGLPQKVHKAFERHPHMFYLSMKNKTCTAILKEAYCDEGAIDPHPLAKVRKSYIGLMKESTYTLRNRRMSNGSRVLDRENVCSENLDCEDDDRSHLAEG